MPERYRFKETILIYFFIVSFAKLQESKEEINFCFSNCLHFRARDAYSRFRQILRHHRGKIAFKFSRFFLYNQILIISFSLFFSGVFLISFVFRYSRATTRYR